MAPAANRTRATSTSKFKEQTGRSWEDWRDWLDGINASEMTHGEIAQRVLDRGGISGWWSQSVTVAYEQHIGRRVPGQVAEGQFATSASKTVDGNLDDVLARFTDHMASLTELAGVRITRGPETSSSHKWRYWRCGLADGGVVSVTMYQKSPGKVAVGVKHDKIDSADRIEVWRDFWKQILKSFS
jgi:hypothetical protein